MWDWILERPDHAFWRIWYNLEVLFNLCKRLIISQVTLPEIFLWKRGLCDWLNGSFRPQTFQKGNVTLLNIFCTKRALLSIKYLEKVISARTKVRAIWVSNKNCWLTKSVDYLLLQFPILVVTVKGGNRDLPKFLIALTTGLHSVCF